MKIQGMHYDLDVLFPEKPSYYEEEEICLKDYEYFKGLYSKELRWIVVIMEECLDHYEYEGSPMYMEYPDAVSIYRMVMDIWKRLSFEGTKQEERQFKDMLQMMVCQEIYIRRRRHDKFCQKWKEMQKKVNIMPYR